MIQFPISEVSKSLKRRLHIFDMMNIELQDILFRFVKEEAPLLFLLVDQEGKIISKNSYSEALFGYSVVNQNVRDLFVLFGENLELSEKVKNPEKAYRLNLQTYTNLPETLYIHFYPVDDKILILGNVNMLEIEQLRKQLISTSSELNSVNRQLQKKNAQLEQATAQLEEMARTDPLTKLSNRRAFYESIVKEVIRFERNKRPFSIVMMDIDHFKKVNDTYGHDCGDYVLVTISNLIRSEIRKQDLLGRWGGEEFIMLLPDTDTKGACKLAEKIRTNIEKADFKYFKYSFTVTLTFGVCEFTQQYKIKECITYADQALYQGKKSGRNKVIVYSNKPSEV